MSQNKRDWEVHPPFLHPEYKSTVLRAPSRPLVPLKHTLSELTGPVYGHDLIRPYDNDLTINARVNGAPLGERIIVAGKVTDERGRPIPIPWWSCGRLMQRDVTCTRSTSMMLRWIPIFLAEVAA